MALGSGERAVYGDWGKGQEPLQAGGRTVAGSLPLLGVMPPWSNLPHRPELMCMTNSEQEKRQYHSSETVASILLKDHSLLRKPCCEQPLWRAGPVGWVREASCQQPQGRTLQAHDSDQVRLQMTAAPADTEIPTLREIPNKNLAKWKVKVLVAQSCLSLFDPTDCGPPGSLM